MTKLELIEHLFSMQENAKMKASYTSDEVVGMLNEISVKVSELILSADEFIDFMNKTPTTDEECLGQINILLEMQNFFLKNN